MTIGEVIKHLTENYSQDEPCAWLIWLPDDVRTLADDKGIAISDEEIAEVLESVEHYKDASLGISWLTIEYHLDELIRRRNE